MRDWLVKLYIRILVSQSPISVDCFKMSGFFPSTFFMIQTGLRQNNTLFRTRKMRLREDLPKPLSKVIAKVELEFGCSCPKPIALPGAGGGEGWGS